MKQSNSGYHRQLPADFNARVEAARWLEQFEKQDRVMHFRRQERDNRPDWAQLQYELRNPFVRSVYNCLRDGNVTVSGIARQLGQGTVFLDVKPVLARLGLTPLTLSDRRLEELLAEGERSIGYLCEKLETTPYRLWDLFHRRPRYADPPEQTVLIQYSDLTPWCDSEALAKAIFKGLSVKEIANTVYGGKTREFARVQIRSRNLMPLLRSRQALRQQLSSEDR